MRPIALALFAAAIAGAQAAPATTTTGARLVAHWQDDDRLSPAKTVRMAGERPVALQDVAGAVRVALIDLGTPAERDSPRLDKTADAIVEWMASPTVLVLPHGSDARSAQNLAMRLNTHAAATRRYRTLSSPSLAADYLVAEPWLAQTDDRGLLLRDAPEAKPLHVVLRDSTNTRDGNALNPNAAILLLSPMRSGNALAASERGAFFEAKLDPRLGAYTATVDQIAFPAERAFASAALLAHSERVDAAAAHLNLDYDPVFAGDASLPLMFSERDPLVVSLTPAAVAPPSMHPKGTTADLKLDLELLAAPPLAIGETFEYRFRVRNLGAGDSANVTLTTQIDPDLIFNSATFPDGWTCPIQPAPGGSGNVTCAAPLLVAGSDDLITLNLTVPMTMGSSSETGLSGQVDSAATPDPNPDNNYAEDVTVVFSFADLRMELDSTPKPVVQGDLITYTYTVINDGPDPAVGVDMTGALPPALEFQSIAPGSGWTCPTVPALNGHGALACHRDVMQVGSETITLVARVADSAINGHEITIGASVLTTQSEEDNSDNNIAEDSNYIREREANLSLAGPAAVTVDRGASAVLAFDIGNGGIDAGKNARFSFPLPAGTTFVSATQPAGWTCTLPAVGGNGTVDCMHPSFAVGGNSSFAIQLAVDADRHNQTLTGTATVASDWFDPLTDDNSADAVLNVRPLADLSIAMTAPNIARPGDAISLVVNVGNTGPDAATEGQVDIVLPADLRYQSIDLPADWTCPTLPAVGTGGSLRCEHGDLPEGAIDSLVVHAEISATAADQALLTATATIGSGGTTTEAEAASNSTSTTTLVNAYKADLAVDLQTTTPNVGSPGLIELSLYFVNEAGDTAHNPGVRIDLPAGTSYVSFYSDDSLLQCEAPSVEAPNTVECRRPLLIEGAGVGGAIQLSVAPQSASATFEFTAEVLADELDPNASNDVDTASVNVQAAADALFGDGFD